MEEETRPQAQSREWQTFRLARIENESDVTAERSHHQRPKQSIRP
jgi:hypothetical protein